MSRDRAIVADRARGLTWARIAERQGLSERHCRTVWKAHLSAQNIPETDLMEALTEALSQLDAVAEDATLLAEATKNDSVRLGAIKQRHVTLAEKFGLMRACGLLPHDLQLWKYEVDARRLVRTIVRTLDEHGVGEAVTKDLVEALDAMSSRRNGHPDGAR